MNPTRIARVVLDRAGPPGERPFDYLIPADWPQELVGSRVRAPLGRQTAPGWIIEVTGESVIPFNQLKPLSRLIDPFPALNEDLLATARHVSAITLVPFYLALKLVSPPDRGRGLATGGRSRRGREPGPLPEAGLAPELLEVAAAGEELGAGDSLELAPASPFVTPRPLNLTPAQERVLRRLAAALEAGEGGEFLLYGVTGSGKTEVYLQLIEQAVEKGLGAIILVPEIALTPQTVARFQARFGPEKVALLHHRLPVSERTEAWWRVRRGEAPIVIGPRSAVFAPVPRLGLVVVDEEHEPSYKQDEAPRYHARDVARFRARFHRGLVVLGSATPSLESFYEARTGRMHLLELPERVGAMTMPRVTLVDLRQEVSTRMGSPFSRTLRERLQEEVSRGNQAILFLNRRGTASFLLCRRCGEVVECPNCRVSLTYHARPVSLRCHYCGIIREVPEVCPRCGEPGALHLLGMGTERVEAAVRELLPNARVGRLDTDSVRHRGAYEEILGKFARRELEILVGTQMVAKGLDFPGVTLVGVILADTSLGFPDLRCTERTFQLLTQVAGRAGRMRSGGENGARGEVIVQTYNPEQYSILLASRYDYPGFYRQEITLRRLLRYPPFTSLARLVFSGSQEAEVQAKSRQVAQELLRLGATTVKEWEGEAEVELIGPAPAPLSRLQRRYRWHLLLKALTRDRLLEFLREWQKGHPSREQGGKVRISIDIDPASML